MAKWDVTPSTHLATANIHPKPKGGSCRVRVYVPDEGGCSHAALLGDDHQPRPERNQGERAHSRGRSSPSSAPTLRLMALENSLSRVRWTCRCPPTKEKRDEPTPTRTPTRTQDP